MGVLMKPISLLYINFVVENFIVCNSTYEWYGILLEQFACHANIFIFLGKTKTSFNWNFIWKTYEKAACLTYAIV